MGTRVDVGEPPVALRPAQVRPGPQRIPVEARPQPHRVVHLIGVTTGDGLADGGDGRGIRRLVGARLPHRAGVCRRLPHRPLGKGSVMQAKPDEGHAGPAADRHRRIERRGGLIRHEPDGIPAVCARCCDPVQRGSDLVEAHRLDDLDGRAERQRPRSPGRGPGKVDERLPHGAQG